MKEGEGEHIVSYEQSRFAHLVEPLVSVHSHLCPQRFGQNQDVARYSTVRPGEHTQDTLIVAAQ